ncbi:hypothetical protein HDR61_02110 [bacterium]|nr:hypothetical protein [bacterium]
MNLVIKMPQLECKDCRLIGGPCNPEQCPEVVAGFSAFDVYGKECRFRVLHAVARAR